MKSNDNQTSDNGTTLNAWNATAKFWDERFGDDGNRFTNELVWPAIHELLAPKPDQQVVELACGNGVIARKMAQLSVQVVASDFSPVFIQCAKERWTGDRIEYHVLDATQEEDLLTLGENRFDAAVCSMALFDIADIQPIFPAVKHMLKPNAPFVFTVIHPCFNNAGMSMLKEQHDLAGEASHSVKISRYLSPETVQNIGMIGQKEPYLLFHRPLQELLKPCFAAGFAIDGLLEPAFSASDQYDERLKWDGRFKEIPPILAVRVR